MGCVFRCCAWCGCVSSRYVNNLQHNFDNFETNASKISKENEQLLFPNYVCNENEEGRASSFANLFLWSSLQKRNNTYETVTIQKDSCRVDDFILRQSTLYYLQCMALRAIRHIKKSLLCSTNLSNLSFRLVASWCSPFKSGFAPCTDSLRWLFGKYNCSDSRTKKWKGSIACSRRMYSNDGQW